MARRLRESWPIKGETMTPATPETAEVPSTLWDVRLPLPMPQPVPHDGATKRPTVPLAPAQTSPSAPNAQRPRDGWKWWGALLCGLLALGLALYYWSDEPPPLAFQVQNLRFFESGVDLSAVAQRQYATQFPKSTTRFVSFQVDGQNHLWRVREHTPKVVGRYYNPDGSIQGQVETEGVINPDRQVAQFSHGLGWQEAGHWPLGTYRVEIVIDGKKVAQDQFTLYEDRQESRPQQESRPRPGLIRQVQERLKAAGCGPGSLDGTLGPRTKEALRCYQIRYRLPVTGELDTATRTALGLP